MRGMKEMKTRRDKRRDERGVKEVIKGKRDRVKKEEKRNGDEGQELTSNQDKGR